MKKSSWLKLYNFWPPFLGAGIAIKEVSEDFRDAEVTLREHFWNRNPMGSHFGGSIYAMTDPFYAMMLKQILGPDYIVWDKAADIRFKKPGKGILSARFNLTNTQIDILRKRADQGHKAEPVFYVDVTNEDGEIVAEVEKTVYIRRKNRRPVASDNSQSETMPRPRILSVPAGSHRQLDH